MLLLGMLCSTFKIMPVQASGTIYIRADGSIDPPSAPIQRMGDEYSVTSNIVGGIVVQRSNIVIDGCGYALEGGGRYGVDIRDPDNVEIKNMRIMYFYAGVVIGSSYNTVTGNYIANNDEGISIWSDEYNSITGNIIENNDCGILTGADAPRHNSIMENYIAGNNVGVYCWCCQHYVFYHNSFVENNQQAVLVYTPGNLNQLDENYWSDYTGVDSDHDGFGDTPYIVATGNVDNRPLMNPQIVPDDLSIVSMEPIQVVEDASALVRNKDTAIRVDIKSTFTQSKWIKIDATYDFQHGYYTEFGKYRKGVEIRPGLNRVYLPGGPIYDKQGDKWVERKFPDGTTWWTPRDYDGKSLGDNFFFRWTTQTGVDDNIQVFLDLDDAIESNNMKRVTPGPKITEVDPLDVVYLPLSIVGEPEPQGIGGDRTNGDLYLGETFPVSKVNSAVGYSKKLLYLETYSCFLNLMVALTTIDTSRRLSSIDKVVCVVPTYTDSWLHHYFPWKFATGTPGATPPLLPILGQLSTVIVEDTYWPAIPHEIGHTFGLRLSQEEYGAGTIGRDASGFYVKKRSELDNSLCIMGASAAGIPLDGKRMDMTYGGKSYTFQGGYWICNECFDNLLNGMKKGPDPEVLYLSGIIFNNDTTVLNDWYHVQNGEVDLPLGQTGNYSVVFLDNNDSVVGQTGFNASLSEGFDGANFAAFVFGAEYPSETRRIRIIHDGVIIADRVVSANSPSVTMTCPNGGETIAEGLAYDVSWTAYDSDGDDIHYTLEYSVDGGVNWLLLATDLNQTHFIWNTSLLEPTAECLVKVIATDGVNTAEDTSDGNFTVDPNAPVINVVSPQNKIYFSNSVPVTLKMIEELSLSGIWYSIDNIPNATIREIDNIIVADGSHQIIFYANDTAGNIGSSGAIHFSVNSTAYGSWNTAFIGSGGYPITDMAEYGGNLYAARDSILYKYNGSEWTSIDAPTNALSLEYFDGMLYIGGKDGLYAFDGSDFYLVFGVPNYIKILGTYNNTLYAGTFLDKPPILYYCKGDARNPDDWQIDTNFSTALNFTGPFGSIDSFATYDCNEGTPMGCWKFDESLGDIAHDSSGNGNMGTLMNWPYWAEGRYGSALSFDGVDDLVSIPDSPTIKASGNQISVELWFKPAATLDNSTAALELLDKGNEYTFILNLEPYQPIPNGKIAFLVYFEGIGRRWVETTTDEWLADTWYHLAGVYDGSQLKIYVNGILQNSIEVSSNLHSESYPLAIGSYTLGTQWFFNGVVDEVKVYNQTRTVEEIWKDYTAQCNVAYVTSGGSVYGFNGTDWDIVKTYEDVYAYLSAQVYEGKLYFATRDQGWRKPMYLGGSGFSGRVIEFDGENWTTILDHDYWIYSLESYDNKLYAGTANKIMIYDGTNWSTSFAPLEGAYYAISLKVFDNKIYSGMGNGYIFADPVSENRTSPDLPPSMTVPEFPLTSLLPLFGFMSSTAVMLGKRRYRRKQKT